MKYGNAMLYRTVVPLLLVLRLFIQSVQEKDQVLMLYIVIVHLGENNYYDKEFVKLGAHSTY